MASFSTTAFDVNAFYVGAFDFAAAPTFQPAFSDQSFGRNTAFSDRAFSFNVTTPPRPTGDDGGQYAELMLRRRFQQQNIDDMDVVRVLTEFLWRIS